MKIYKGNKNLEESKIENIWISLNFIFNTHGCNVDEANEKSKKGNNEDQLPVFRIREMIAKDAKNGAAKSDSASNAEHEHHDEEKDGEKLWNKIELGQRFRIRDESQPCTTTNHLWYIRVTQFVGQIPENPKNRTSCYQTGESVQSGHYQYVPANEKNSELYKI